MPEPPVSEVDGGRQGKRAMDNGRAFQSCRRKTCNTPKSGYHHCRVLGPRSAFEDDLRPRKKLRCNPTLKGAAAIAESQARIRAMRHHLRVHAYWSSFRMPQDYYLPTLVDYHESSQSNRTALHSCRISLYAQYTKHELRLLCQWLTSVGRLPERGFEPKAGYLLAQDPLSQDSHLSVCRDTSLAITPFG